ncbi:cytochrome c maturation protein CcmE [Hellea sp.]|nr:cytochrome c maturation protein CcmE [Hellea sp.]
MPCTLAYVTHITRDRLNGYFMTPPHQKRRIGLIVLFGSLLAIGVALLLSALQENTQFFYNPSDVVAESFSPDSNTFRIGGLVEDGTVIKDGKLKTTFQIKDFERDMRAPMTVSYVGVLPDLFREGQGVVVTGFLTSPTAFEATEVLAKHDENYKPDINYQTK